MDILDIINNIINLLDKDNFYKYCFYLLSIFCIYRFIYIEIYKKIFLKLQLDFKKILKLDKSLCDFRAFLVKKIENIEILLNDIKKMENFIENKECLELKILNDNINKLYLEINKIKQINFNVKN